MEAECQVQAATADSTEYSGCRAVFLCCQAAQGLPRQARTLQSANKLVCVSTCVCLQILVCSFHASTQGKTGTEYKVYVLSLRCTWTVLICISMSLCKYQKNRGIIWYQMLKLKHILVCTVVYLHLISIYCVHSVAMCQIDCDLPFHIRAHMYSASYWHVFSCKVRTRMY